MKKVKIFLCGGFGNNLFQISYGEYLESKGFDVIYNCYLTRRNFLTKWLGWAVHNNEITGRLLDRKNTQAHINVIDIIYLFCSFFCKKISGKKFYNIPESVRGRYFGYAAIGPHLNKEVIGRISRDIRKLYIETAIKCVSTVDTVLHIRRGDFSPDCSLTASYYVAAIEKLGHPKSVTVVTDDHSMMDYIKQNISQNVKLSNGVSMLDDFFVIFNAKNVIMSNSTYCYWACILGNVERVTYPSRISTTQKWVFGLDNLVADEISCNFLSELECIG